MNWESNKPFPSNGTIKEEYDTCEHVDTDPSLAHWMFCEDDAFGPVIRNVVCKTCKEATLKAISEAIELCDDCLEECKAVDMIHYKSYHFDPRQGDEVLNVCPACAKLPEHLARLEDDRRRRRSDEADAWDEEHYDEDEDEKPPVVIYANLLNGHVKFTATKTYCEEEIEEERRDDGV